MPRGGSFHGVSPAGEAMETMTTVAVTVAILCWRPLLWQWSPYIIQTSQRDLLKRYVAILTLKLERKNLQDVKIGPGSHGLDIVGPRGTPSVHLALTLMVFPSFHWFSRWNHRHSLSAGDLFFEIQIVVDPNSIMSSNSIMASDSTGALLEAQARDPLSQSLQELLSLFLGYPWDYTGIFQEAWGLCRFGGSHFPPWRFQNCSACLIPTLPVPVPAVPVS